MIASPDWFSETRAATTQQQQHNSSFINSTKGGIGTQINRSSHMPFEI